MHIADVVFLILVRASSRDERASRSSVPGDGCLQLAKAGCLYAVRMIHPADADCFVSSGAESGTAQLRSN